MTSAEALHARHAQLVADVRAHKSAIRRHREGLVASKGALVAFEDECRRMGIHIISSSPGEGTRSHGHTEDPAA